MFVPVTCKCSVVWSSPVSIKGNTLPLRQIFLLLKELLFWLICKNINKFNLAEQIQNSSSSCTAEVTVASLGWMLPRGWQVWPKGFPIHKNYWDFKQINIFPDFFVPWKQRRSTRWAIYTQLVLQTAAESWENLLLTVSWETHKGSYFHIMSFTQHLESWQELILQRSQLRFVCLIENREPKKLRLPVPCWRSSNVPWGCAYNCPAQHGAAWSAKALRETYTYLVPDPGALQVIMLGRLQLTGLFWRSLEVCQGGVCFRGLKMMLVRAAKRERDTDLEYWMRNIGRFQADLSWIWWKFILSQVLESF